MWVSGIYFADERHVAQNVPLRIPPVGAAVDKGKGDVIACRAEQDDGWGGHPLVDFAGEFGIVAAGVSVVAEFYGKEQEAQRVARVKAPGVEHHPLRRSGGDRHLGVSHLKN